MARLTYLLLLLALNASNYFLARNFLSPPLPSEVQALYATLAHFLGDTAAQAFVKWDLLLVWLGANLLLLQLVFWAKRQTHPGAELSYGWFIFSFTVPLLAADYSFDYKSQSFGEYIDLRYRAIVKSGGYPNRYGRALAEAIRSPHAQDFTTLLGKVTAPKLGELAPYGTLSELCVNQYAALIPAKSESPDTEFACALVAKIQPVLLTPFEMEARCFAGPGLKTLYALDQGGRWCPLPRVDLFHYKSLCDLMTKTLKIPPIAPCRMLNAIPLQKLKRSQDGPQSQD